jgi:outer membrane protein TolC
MRAAVAAAAAVTAGAALFPPAFVAQEPTPVPARLTLEDALLIARERNPQYLQSVHNARAQGPQVRAAWGAFLPDVTANVSFSGSDSRTVTGEDDFGQPVALPQPVNFKGSSSSQSVGARLTLFDGLANLTSLRAARESQDAAESARGAARNRVDAETTRRFYDAIRARQLIVLEERLLASAEQQRENTSRLFRAAGATQEDLLGAEADVANQQATLARARGEAEKAVLALREYLGITEDIVFELQGDLPAAEDPFGLQADSLVRLALSAHPDVRRLEDAAQAAHLRASAARGSRWPSVTLDASYARSASLSSYEALFDFNPRNRSFRFAIGLTYPLFTGFQTSARVAQSDADARSADEQTRAGRLQVERDVRSALIDVQNAFRSVQLAERSSELSSERLRLARERYAIGAITFANLQLLIDRAAQEERGLITARYGYGAARAALTERVGQ